MEHIFINPLDDTCFKLIFGPKVGYNNMLNFLRGLMKADTRLLTSGNSDSVTKLPARIWALN